MMEFLLLASAHFLALLSPGPDFFLIMQASLRLPVLGFSYLLLKKRLPFRLSAGHYVIDEDLWIN